MIPLIAMQHLLQKYANVSETVGSEPGFVVQIRVDKAKTLQLIEICSDPSSELSQLQYLLKNDAFLVDLEARDPEYGATPLISAR